MAKKGKNLIDMQVDWSELVEATEFLKQYSSHLDTSAFKKPLVEATYNALTQEFDVWMKVWATAQRARFTHVYEYAINGDPYRHVGDPKYKLWKHVMAQGGGGSVTATFTFLPAKHRIPTPRQRRNSTVGDDPIRHISENDFQEYLKKTKNIRYTFLWKAPMNEYGITRRVTPQNVAFLFLPVKDFHTPMASSIREHESGRAKGSGWRFATSYTLTQDPPGNSFGAFTHAWSMFWGKELTDQKFDRIVGDKAAEVIETAMAKGLNNIRKGGRRRRVDVVVNHAPEYSKAIAAGRKQAMEAAKLTDERIKGMNRASQWNLHPDGGLGGGRIG